MPSAALDQDLIKTTLKTLIEHLGLHCDDVKTAEENGNILRVDIASSDASRLIGWHGETLNSLQHLTKAIVRTQQKLDHNPFIVLDVDGYRRMQEDKVRRIAEQKADFVRRTGNRIALSPMSPYFRRIVHLHVAETPALQDLTTESVGEGDYRQIVMRLKNEKNAGSEELSPVLAPDDDLGNLDV